MTSLVRKELRSLVPYVVAFAALVMVATLAASLNGDYTVAPLGSRYGTTEGHFFALLLGLLLGHGLVAHEYVSGHIEFLDGLPTTRGRVFAAKVIAGTVTLLLLLGLSASSELLMQIIAPVPHQIASPRPIVIGHLVMGATLWFGFGAGLLLSWIRGLAVGVVVAAVVVGMVIVFAVPPLEDLVPLPGSGYGQLTWTHGVPTHPVVPPLVWTGVGTIAMLLSAALFQGPGGALLARGSASMAIVRWIGLALGSVTLVLGGLAGFLATGFTLEDFEPIIVVDPPGPLRVLHFPSNADHVAEVTADLEARTNAISRLIGAPLPAGPLDLEFLGTQPNHGGVFTGGKIRLRPDADAEVLTHELAHAIAFERLGPAGWHQRAHTRFFNEGLANWVDDELTGDGLDPLQAGLTRALDLARFDLLVDDERLVAEQDIEQAYHLGEVFVRALVDVGGRAAIPCILDALGDAGRDEVAGLALWYGAAERCDLDLDGVVVRWRDRLDAISSRLPPLPRIRVERVNLDEGGWGLFVTDEAQTTWPLVCRFRSDVSSSVDVYQQTNVGPEGYCRVPLETLAGPTYDYQVGFSIVAPELDGVAFAFWPWVFEVPRR